MSVKTHNVVPATLSAGVETCWAVALDLAEEGERGRRFLFRRAVHEDLRSSSSEVVAVAIPDSIALKCMEIALQSRQCVRHRWMSFRPHLVERADWPDVGIREYHSPGASMTKVEALEDEIEKLSPPEFAELRNWLLERDWENWDRQIERDSESGKLERLFEEAQEAHRQGKSTKF